VSYERQRRYDRRKSSESADIGKIPRVANPQRRESCRLDLHRFLTHYFPLSTGQSPFSSDHVRAISRLQECILEGGRFGEAMFRGSAKTTIGENATLWATLYGHRRFVPILGSDAKAAESNIDSIQLELSENDLLYADFPEVCHAVRALEGKPQRCASQTHRPGNVEGFEPGEDVAPAQTHIVWTSDTIVLPTIILPDGPSGSSGAIITAHGLLGASRGMKHKRPDGTQQRPDFVFIDDAQTDESAKSPAQVEKRLSIIKKNILRLGGHARKIAVFMAATIIEQNDVADQLLNPKRNPVWQAERIPMVRKWPGGLLAIGAVKDWRGSDVHERMWLTEYRHIRETYDPNLPGDQRRAHAEAREFVRQHFDVMHRGAEVTWESGFDPDVELSALQHAYDILIDDGPEAFASECQCEPLSADAVPTDDLTSDKIRHKINRVDRGRVPADVSRVVAFIDVQKDLLYWMVAGFADDFSGYVLDYGGFPDQKRAYFSYANARVKLKAVTKTDSLEATIYAGLDLLTAQLMKREWIRDDSAPMKPERILVDAGYEKEVVHKFCRHSAHAAVLMPSIGRFIGASSNPFNSYKKKRGDRVGINWRILAAQGPQMVREVQFDANAFKTFVRSRLSVPLGGPGCLSLFGEDPETHRMLADHILAERGTEVTAKGGRTVIEYKLLPGRPDNHEGDCLVGCHVAAAMQGVDLKETARPHVRRVKVKLSELQRQKRLARTG
jgi:hypothetical protein